ncbi:hypothetical protein BDR22DRAFT_972810 [Usnea florida]
MHIHLPSLTSVFVWWPFLFVRYGGLVLLIFFGMNMLISFAIAVYFQCTHSSIPSLRYYEAWKGSMQEVYVSYGLALVAGLLSWKMSLLHNPQPSLTTAASREKPLSVSSETKDTDSSSDSGSLTSEFLDVSDRGYLENLEVSDHGYAHCPEQSQSQHTAVESRGLASAISVEHLPPHVEQSLFALRCQSPISLAHPESDGHPIGFNLGWTAESNDMAQPGPSATPCPVHAHYRLPGDKRKRQIHRRRRTGDLSTIEPFPLLQAETDQQRYRMTEPFPLFQVETDQHWYRLTEPFPLLPVETDQHWYRLTEPFPLLPVETDLRRYHATVRDEQDEGEASSSLPFRPILINSVDATNTPSPITQGTEPVPVVVETSTPPENLREPLRTPPKINLDFNATLFSHDFDNAAHSPATSVPVEQGTIRREKPLLSVIYRSPYVGDRPSVLVRHQPRSPAISSSLGVSQARASAALFHQFPAPEPANNLPALSVAEFGFLLDYDGAHR